VAVEVEGQVGELTVGSGLPTLSIGLVADNKYLDSRYWTDSVTTLSRQVKTLQQQGQPVMPVVLMYLVFPMRREEFAGIRRRRYLNGDRPLIVEAAVNGAGGAGMSAAERRAVLLALAWGAAESAADYARQQGLADSLPEINRIVTLLAAMPATDGKGRTQMELDVGTDQEIWEQQALRRFWEGKGANEVPESDRGTD
jgi:hypothetical protein